MEDNINTITLSTNRNNHELSLMINSNEIIFYNDCQWIMKIDVNNKITFNENIKELQKDVTLEFINCIEKLSATIRKEIK